jgi:hypothetical protein
LEAEDLLGEVVRAGEDPDVIDITEGGTAVPNYWSPKKPSSCVLMLMF